MKQFILTLFLVFSFSAYSQGELAYQCSPLGKKAVDIIVTNASKPLVYQGKKVYIVKYDLQYGDTILSTFYTYKWNSKLYILDGTMTKINPSKDPVLFQLPHGNSQSINLSGIWGNMTLMLNKFYSINDQDFYIYHVSSMNNSHCNIGQMIFDKNLDISEIQLKTKTSNCNCTKKKIVIKLK